MSASSSKPGGSGQSGQSGQGRPMLTGILIGLVAGVGISAAVAVWVARMPSPFQNRALEGATVEAPRSSSPAATAAPAPTAPTAAAASSDGTQAAQRGAAPEGAVAGGGSAVGNATSAGAPNPAGTASAGAAGSPTAGQAPSSLTVSKTLNVGSTWLQVGAFTTEEDALKQVESVAMLTGVRASVQPLQQADKVLYRVRLGPYGQKADYAELSEALKSNGISAAVIHTTGQ